MITQKYWKYIDRALKQSESIQNSMLYICSFVVENSKQNLVIEDNVDDSKRDHQTKKMERERETQLHCTRFLT